MIARPHSLRSRFLAVSLVAIALALLVAGFAIQYEFRELVWRHEANELDHEIDKIAGGLKLSSGGAWSIAAHPANPLYDTPFGGAYWQVTQGGNVVLRSRSLWDEALPIPACAAGQSHGTHRIAGPAGASLFVVAKDVSLRTAGGNIALCIAAAIDASVYEAAVAHFQRQLFIYLGILATLLSLASLAQVRFGLKPFTDVERDIARIKANSGERIGDGYPAEVQPLVTQINDLLTSREKAAEQARHRAADLAHGLKTPVAVLQALVGDLQRKGETEIAHELERQAKVIHTRSIYEIAKAKAAAAGHSPAAPVTVRPLALNLAATVLRASAREINLKVDMPRDLVWRMSEDDTLEVLGVVLDNAVKWARGNVELRGWRSGGRAIVEARDDGPGGDIAANLADIQRGRRHDSSVPGTGYGLSIARDVIEAYGGELDFTKGDDGGLVVTIAVQD